MEFQRLFLYTSLGVLLLLLWNAWQREYQPVAPPPTAAVSEQPPATGAAPEAEAVQGQAAPAAPAPSGLVQAQSIRVVTDLLDVTISTQGGDLRTVRLPEYTVSVESEEPFTLLTAEEPLFIAQSGLQAQNLPAPGHQALFQAQQTEYRLAPGEDRLVVPLVWTSPEGIEVVKRYVFHRNRYLVELEQELRNGSGQPWQGFQYAQLRRTPPPEQGGFFGVHTYTGGIVHTPEERYQKFSFDDIAAGKVRQDAVGGWLAYIQHYFLAAWIPPAEISFHYYAKAVDGQRILGMSSAWRTVAPGEQTVFNNELYVGPKEQDRLAGIAPDLELTVDYGKLTIIAKPLFWLLDKIHGLVGNWGWAIILLTLLIKIVFYKLSETSYRSMARMRTLQPKMQALKERYGEDKQKLNQELMELYKKEKINPLGGCLPILVQIPVFIALYWTLLESVELRQADWILWINDLSVRDPYFVLPLIMGLSMFIQQRLNPQPMDPVQQKVMTFLPLVFTVFFLFFPAGLVLYWVTNNLLSIAQQWIITRRMEKGAKK